VDAPLPQGHLAATANAELWVNLKLEVPHHQLPAPARSGRTREEYRHSQKFS
jgi:hypothetical protein